MTMKRIVGPTQLTAAAATYYTAPTGIRAVIKRIHLLNTDVAARTVTISTGADAAGTRLYQTQTLAANGGYFDDYANYTLEPAEILQANADVTLKVTMTVNADLTAT